jgi:hypothetical protein
LQGDLRAKDAGTGYSHPANGRRIHRHNLPSRAPR